MNYNSSISQKNNNTTKNPLSELKSFLFRYYIFIIILALIPICGHSDVSFCMEPEYAEYADEAFESVVDRTGLPVAFGIGLVIYILICIFGIE